MHIPEATDGRDKCSGKAKAGGIALRGDESHSITWTTTLRVSQSIIAAASLSS